jgi:dihydropteroate synthase
LLFQRNERKIMQLSCGVRTLDLTVPRIMGVLNTTPDSFSDGGRYYSQSRLSLDLALRHAEQMVSEGAAIIDIGGESTRPGAVAVSLQEECDRVLPVVEALAERLDTVISVDTSSPELMLQAASLGAGFINDVRALQRHGAIEAAAQTKLAVCLMHMQGMPATMQDNPHYSDVVGEVERFLRQRMIACNEAGIPSHRLCLDPGFGFGKADSHNLALLNHLRDLECLGLPLLAGLSRKSMIGRLLNREVNERVIGSAGFALIAMQNGAKILRVHDVAATRDMVEIFKLTHY